MIIMTIFPAQNRPSLPLQLEVIPSSLNTNHLLRILKLHYLLCVFRFAVRLHSSPERVPVHSLPVLWVVQVAIFRVLDINLENHCPVKPKLHKSSLRAAPPRSLYRNYEKTNKQKCKHSPSSRRAATATTLEILSLSEIS